MNDEKYVFIKDISEKKNIARSAFNKNRKGGAVKFPSDYLSKKELKAMNGEIKSYRLNDPMKWAEFKAMPDDIKISYIKLIREKFNASDSKIAEMFGISKVTLSNYFKCLGLNKLNNSRGKDTKWDKDGFYAWVHGVSIPMPHTEASQGDSTEVCEHKDKPSIIEQVDSCIYDPETGTYKIKQEFLFKLIKKLGNPLRVHPTTGSMELEGKAENVLESVKLILGDSIVKLKVEWEFCDIGG